MRRINEALLGKWQTVFAFVMLATFALVSCSKPETPVTPPVDTRSYIKLAASGLQADGAQLQALVSIEKVGGEAVATNKKVSLSFVQGRWVTENIQVAKGEFKVTKFIVLNAAEKALHASPLTGSAKAALVNKSLPIQVGVQDPGVIDAAVQVIQVGTADQPQSFGYAETDFGAANMLSILVSLSVNVGTVAYEQIPATLKVEATKLDGSKWNREIDLAKGVTTISIPDGYENYSLSAAKWNVLASKQLTRQEITNNMTVQLTANRQAKRLIGEQTFLENSAGLLDDSKTEYIYTGDKLTGIKYYQKKPQTQTLQLTWIYDLQHFGNNVSKIIRYDASNMKQSELRFEYNGAKVTNMFETGVAGDIGGAVEYGAETGRDIITTDFIFSNGNSMTHRIELVGGNIAKEKAVSSTGGREEGVYEYDSNINPYHTLNYPNKYFTQLSKNNRINEQRSYGGGFPTQLAYKWEYVYDSDGYPKELYTSYKGYSSNTHLYRIKKVFTYQQ